jgi:hypothetical protein
LNRTKVNSTTLRILPALPVPSSFSFSSSLLPPRLHVSPPLPPPAPARFRARARALIRARIADEVEIRQHQESCALQAIKQAAQALPFSDLYPRLRQEALKKLALCLALALVLT